MLSHPVHVECLTKLNERLEVKVRIFFTGKGRMLHHADRCGLDLERPSDLREVQDW
jgi:hypothetical protein